MQIDENVEPSDIADTTEPAGPIELQDLESTEDSEPATIYNDIEL